MSTHQNNFNIQKLVVNFGTNGDHCVSWTANLEEELYNALASVGVSGTYECRVIRGVKGTAHLQGKVAARSLCSGGHSCMIRAQATGDSNSEAREMSLIPTKDSSHTAEELLYLLKDLTIEEDASSETAVNVDSGIVLERIRELLGHELNSEFSSLDITRKVAKDLGFDTIEECREYVKNHARKVSTHAIELRSGVYMWIQVEEDNSEVKKESNVIPLPTKLLPKPTVEKDSMSSPECSLDDLKKKCSDRILSLEAEKDEYEGTVEDLGGIILKNSQEISKTDAQLGNLKEKLILLEKEVSNLEEERRKLEDEIQKAQQEQEKIFEAESPIDCEIALCKKRLATLELLEKEDPEFLMKILEALL